MSPVIGPGGKCLDGGGFRVNVKRIIFRFT